jgi:hypothetical protein
MAGYKTWQFPFKSLQKKKRVWYTSQYILIEIWRSVGVGVGIGLVYDGMVWRKSPKRPKKRSEILFVFYFFFIFLKVTLFPRNLKKSNEMKKPALHSFIE